MEAIRDLSWLYSVHAAARREGLDLQGYRVSILQGRRSAAHHLDRYLYRLLAFDPSQGKPILSIGLESDILGEFCLSLQSGREQRILARFDEEPSYESFKETALAAADEALKAEPALRAAAKKPARGQAKAHLGR